jgi:hypothetical protein
MTKKHETRKHSIHTHFQDGIFYWKLSFPFFRQRTNLNPPIRSLDARNCNVSNENVVVSNTKNYPILICPNLP